MVRILPNTVLSDFVASQPTAAEPARELALARPKMALESACSDADRCGFVEH
jgi:hypothetical protein